MQTSERTRNWTSKPGQGVRHSLISFFLGDDNNLTRKLEIKTEIEIEDTYAVHGEARAFSASFSPSLLRSIGMYGHQASEMIDRVSAQLCKLRWRTVILTLVALSMVHFVFVDDTLRSLYSTRVGGQAIADSRTSAESMTDGKTVVGELAKVKEKATAPLLGFAPGVKVEVTKTEVEVTKTEAVQKTTAAAAPTNPYADDFPLDPSPVPSAPVTAATTLTSTPHRTRTTTYIPTPTAIAPFNSGDKDEYLAICVAVKDQYADLTEWLTHHYHHLGIRRFYLMDDGSSPALVTQNYSSFLDPRAITHRYYHPAFHVRYMQLNLYNECLQLFGHKHKWMAFIDADEFFEVRGNTTLQSILREHDADPTIGAFAVNWRIHTSAGLLTRPPSARKAFTACIEDQDPNHAPTVGTENEHIKVIVKPSLAVGAAGPHKFSLKNGTRTVGEDGDTVDRAAWRVPITRRRVALHHYATKSREEYEEKIARSNGMGDAKGWKWWKWVEEIPTMECNELAVLEP